MVLLQFYSSICSGREPLGIGGTGTPSCRSVNCAKALKETPSSDLNQEKSTHQPQPFLIHCRTPEQRSVVPFTPALTPVQGYHSPDRKNPRTFPDFSRRNCDNKCTFIDTKSASYEVSVAFRQLSKANSKR